MKVRHLSRHWSASAPNAGTLSGNHSICIGDTSFLSSTVSGGVWTSSQGSVATVDSNTGAVVGIGSGNTIITYTIIGCRNVSITFTMTVKPNNTIILISPSGSNNQTVIDSNAINPISYETTGATGAIVTGLPSGVSFSWTPNLLIISGIPTITGTFNYTVTMIGGCNVGSNVASGSITVNSTGSGLGSRNR